MLFSKFIKPVFVVIARYIALWCARQRRQRSIHAMEQLDSHLLADIGFRREGDRYVPLNDVTGENCSVSVRHHRRKARLRCSFLVRRRERLRRGEASA